MSDRQFGPYRLDKLLGRGGMGEVYLAYDTGHRRDVAVKLLLESLSGDQEYRSRFEREARIAAGLREQHIIPIHRYGEIDNRLYIEMRLVDGEDLGKLLARTGPLPVRRAVGIIQQVAAALDAAHREGLLHRDVKPANVLLADAGGAHHDAVYLADFGIARSTLGSSTRLTLTGAAVGTPDYMAPERFTGGVIDCRADVYALACMLYEMVAGRKPFVADEFAALLYKHMNESPPRPSTLQAGIPRALDAVIEMGMAKDPDRRHRSAGLFATAADAALVSPATGSRPRETLPTPQEERNPPAPPSDPGSPWAPLSAGRRWSRWFYDVTPTDGPTPTRPWPTATEYVHAVQAAAGPPAGIPDARLARDPIGMPASSSGQNAIVFELDHPAGPLALRCFTRSPRDAAARYRSLAPVLAAAANDVVAPARWIDGTVDVGGERWPAVVMPWVPGVPLDTAVESMLERPAKLADLAGSWRSVLVQLAGAGLAHGDLQCGNVIVGPAGELHLVDLDGFHVPTMTSPPSELGHPDFQHPNRTAQDWGPDIDGFSGAVIYLSLLGLAADPGLWRFNSAENLILAKEDYEGPDRTPVWQALRDSPDPEVARLSALLAGYCAAPHMPSVADVLAHLEKPTDRVTPRSVTPAPTAVGPAPSGETVIEKWWADDTVIPESPVRQSRGATPVGRAFGRNSVTTGLTAGLLCAALIVAAYAALGGTLPLMLRAPILIALAGGVLTAGLAAIPRATMGAWRTAGLQGLGGVLLGVGASLGGLGLFELFAYSALKQGAAPVLLIVAWTVCAISIGLAAGVMQRSGRAVVSGLLGGAIGGATAGVVHWASGPEFIPTDEKNSYLDINILNPPTLIAVVLASVAIGLSIGLVDRARRRTWLTVIEGGLRGREVIVNRRDVAIGAAETATLRLHGDPGVRPVHAVLSSAADDYTVHVHERIEVNGIAQAPSSAVALNSGDVLRIGGSFIRFQQRERR